MNTFFYHLAKLIAIKVVDNIHCWSGLVLRIPYWRFKHINYYLNLYLFCIHLGLFEFGNYCLYLHLHLHSYFYFYFINFVLNFTKVYLLIIWKNKYFNFHFFLFLWYLIRLRYFIFYLNFIVINNFEFK